MEGEEREKVRWKELAEVEGRRRSISGEWFDLSFAVNGRTGEGSKRKRDRIGKGQEERGRRKTSAEEK